MYFFAVSYYSNCRCCDSGSYSEILCKESIDEIKDYILSNLQEYEVHQIYQVDKNMYSVKLVEVGGVTYHLSRHHCSGATFWIENEKWSTVDNGSGKFIWVTA